MTLIVSLRTVDGIVLAGDSLATYTSYPQVKGDVQVICPECGFEHTTEATLWGNALPSRTLSYAQKVFPFLGQFGVGTFGQGQLNGKTIYFAMREFQEQLVAAEVDSTGEAARLIGEELHDLWVKDVEGKGLAVDLYQDDIYYVGVQVVGYDGNEPVTYDVRVGKKVSTEKYEGLDVTPSGMDEVFWALYGIYNSNPDSVPLIHLFSLQDAIDYAEFLIKTTALHQQFSRRIPSVGGDIDVAVVTPFDRFKWVRQKTLYRKIETEDL